MNKKLFLNSISIVFMLFAVVLVTGCNKKENDVKDNKQSTETKKDDQTVNKTDTDKMVKDGKYFCPMHPAQQTDDPAVKCPICKMKLNPKTEYNKKMSEEHEALETKYAGKKDLIHFEVKLSVIKSDECERLIETALSSDKGVVEYHIDIVNKVIHMYIDKSKTTKSNVEKVISDAGFDANDTKAGADAIAKLPAGCK
ncbi:MAG: hypothetical protein IAE93_02995 [Ignavibacteria bacterium]|nr:hypothetical protein [Ignavibacteria bacterium]